MVDLEQNMEPLYNPLSDLSAENLLGNKPIFSFPPQCHEIITIRSGIQQLSTYITKTPSYSQISVSRFQTMCANLCGEYEK
mgnify:CR=1 FL=1